MRQITANAKAGGRISAEDMRLVTQATQLGAELWTLDQKTFVKQPGNLAKNFPTLKIAPESRMGVVSGKPNDYRVGRKLMGLGDIIVDFQGRITEPPPDYGGGGGGGKLTAHVGEADMRPVETSALNAGPAAAAGGLVLIFQGVQMIVNQKIDAQNREDIKKDLTRLGPAIAKNREIDPTQGVLLIFNFQAGANVPIGSVKPAARYLFVEDYYGHTEQEARQSIPATAKQAGIVTTSSWVPPLVPPGVETLKTPFPPFAIGTFMPGQAVLQDVNFDCTGFDDEGATPLDVPDGMTPQFIILDPPKKVKYQGPYWGGETELPIIWRKTGEGNATIPIVNLDPVLSWFYFDAAAAMIFPADDATQDLFDGTYTMMNWNTILGART